MHGVVCHHDVAVTSTDHWTSFLCCTVISMYYSLLSTIFKIVFSMPMSTISLICLMPMASSPMLIEWFPLGYHWGWYKIYFNKTTQVGVIFLKIKILWALSTPLHSQPNCQWLILSCIHMEVTSILTTRSLPHSSFVSVENTQIRYYFFLQTSLLFFNKKFTVIISRNK